MFGIFLCVGGLGRKLGVKTTSPSRYISFSTYDDDISRLLETAATGTTAVKATGSGVDDADADIIEIATGRSGEVFSRSEAVAD